MLKLLLGAITILLITMNGVAQSTEEKVEDFLGPSKYNQLQSQNSALILFLKTKVEEGFVINQSIDTKKDSYVRIDRVFYKKNEISIEDFQEALDKESFNILNYSFPNQDTGKTTHYLLGDSNTLLTIYSNSVINRKIASDQ